MKAFLDLFRNPGFGLVNLVNLLEGICYFGMVPLLIPFLRQHFHLDDVSSGYVLSYYVGLVTLLMFPGGRVCDRLGARRSLILAVAVVAAGRSLLVYSAQAGLGWALAALTLMAGGTGIVQPSVYAGVKEYTRDDQAAAGYSWLYSIMNLGSVLWFLLSPQVRAGGGIDRVYLVLTLLTWLNWAVQLLAFRHSPIAKTNLPGPRACGPSLINWRFLVFIWLLIPVRNLVAHLNFTLPTVVERVYPWAFGYLEYGYALNNLLLFVGTPLLTYATMRYDLLGLMIGGSLLSAGSLGFLMLAPETRWLFAFVVFFSLGEAIWQSRFYEYVAHQAPPGKVGEAMSLANFPWFVAKTTAGLYSGWMLAHFVPALGSQRPQGLWGCYLAVALLTPLTLAVLRGWLKQGLGSDRPEAGSR